MESTNPMTAVLSELQVRPIERSEEARYRAQMAQPHYLGDLAKIGESIWYVATWREQWVAQINVSAAALKCGVRDRWIGWDFRTQYDRLKRIANNSRFLILPDWRRPNVGSRVRALTERRITHDWRERFGCRREHGRYVVPSEWVIRDCLVRIEPDALDRALNAWNQAWGKEVAPPDHGRIQTRRIGCGTALNAYLDFPHVGQAVLIERESIEKKTGKRSHEIALGITRQTPNEASAQPVLAINRGHWSIESTHHIIDWNYDEDRSRMALWP